MTRIHKVIIISAITLFAATATVTISTTLALYQKSQTLNVTNNITGGGARNDEIFLARVRDSRTPANADIVWNNTEHYNIYMLAYNEEKINLGYRDSSAFTWILGTSVNEENVTVAYPSTANAYDDNETANYIYFHFNPTLYDHFSFHRIIDTQPNNTYDSNGAIVSSGTTAGVPTLFEHRDMNDSGIGMSTNATSELTKPAKYGYNTFQLSCRIKQWATDGYHSYGSWLEKRMYSTEIDEIDYGPQSVTNVGLIGSYKGHNLSWATDNFLTGTAPNYSIDIDFYRNDEFLIRLNSDNNYQYGYSDVISSCKQYVNQGSNNIIQVNYEGWMTVSFSTETNAITITPKS